MVRTYILILGIVLSVVSCSSKDPNLIQYQIASVHKDSIHQLKVAMSFMPSQDGLTILEYPNNAWGQENLHNAVKQMELVDVKGTIETNKDSGWIELKHPKDLKELQFRYVLQQDYQGPITSRKVYRPIIQPDYFHIFSHNLFMVPRTAGDTLDVDLNWIDFKDDEVVHNSFGSKKKHQQVRDIPKSKFLESIFVGGSFTIDVISINDNKVYLATRGNWIPFSVDEVKGLLTETLKCQRDFWKDHSQEYFTVTMQPIPQESGSSFQGTGLTNSFATSISNNNFTDIEQLVYLFNHELMHNWIGLAIKNENEEEQYWFSEGFTEYYTYKNVAKNKINDLDGTFFIDGINQTIKNLYSLSIKEVSNSEMNYENFWSNYEYRKLPYYRGALFAFYLDYSILKTSDGDYSLDDVMRDLLKAAEINHQRLNHSFFVSTLKKYFPNNADITFKEFVEKGKLLPLAGFFSDINVEFQPTTKLFELGFQLSEDGTQVNEVIAGSEAWKTGLRDGDKLFSRSIYYGNVSKKVELGVLKDGNKVNIDFYPVKMANVPQMKITETNLRNLGF